MMMTTTTRVMAAATLLLLICSTSYAYDDDDTARPKPSRNEDTSELKKQIASLSSKVSNLETLIARAGTLQVEFETVRDDRDRLARESKAAQHELTVAQQDLVAAQQALHATQEALQTAEDAAAAAAKAHAAEQRTLSAKIADLESNLAPLKQQTARLKAVEKELDRTKLALEELQQAQDALLDTHAALQRRAARPLAINLTAMVPASLLARGDATIKPLLAPVMPALQRAWTGTTLAAANVWAGASAAWIEYVPVVVDASKTALRVGSQHAAAGVEAARAYIQETGLEQRLHVLLAELKALLAAQLIPFPSLAPLTQEPLLSYALYTLLVLPVALVSLPLLSCCCTRRKRRKPKQATSSTAPPRPTPRKTRSRAAQPLSDDGLSADEMTFVKGRRQPQGAPTSPPPGSVVRTPGTSVRARGASVRVA